MTHKLINTKIKAYVGSPVEPSFRLVTAHSQREAQSKTFYCPKYPILWSREEAIKIQKERNSLTGKKLKKLLDSVIVGKPVERVL